MTAAGIHAAFRRIQMVLRRRYSCFQSLEFLAGIGEIWRQFIRLLFDFAPFFQLIIGINA